MSPILLRGITWNHERGVGGLRHTAVTYEASRPDIRVEWDTRSLQAFADEPVDELARRFDLLYVDHPAIGFAAGRGCLLPLDRCLDATVLADRLRACVGRSADSYEWQGHAWALATDGAAQVAAYRPDLLDRANLDVPRTWDEAIRAAGVLRRLGTWAAMPAIPVDALCVFLAACVALGEEPLASEESRVVSRETGRDALDVLATFLGRAHPSSLRWNPPTTLEHMSTTDEVAYCPLAFGYSNYARPGFRGHVVRFAGGPEGEDGVPRGTLGGAGLAISAYSQEIDEAARYAAFVSDPETQRTVYFEGGGQPGNRAAWTDRAVNAAATGFFEDTLAGMEGAYLRPRYNGFLQFQDAAGRLIHAYLSDPGDPDAVLDRLDIRYRESLARAGQGVDTERV